MSSLSLRFLQVIQRVQAGGVLQSPRLCNDVVAKIMQGCWHQDPLKRLTVAQIRCDLEHLTSNSDPAHPYLEIIDTNSTSPTHEDVAVNV